MTIGIENIRTICEEGQLEVKGELKRACAHFIPLSSKGAF